MFAAPYVEIIANDTLYEGDDLYITCHENVQQNPGPGTYIFEGTNFRRTFVVSLVNKVRLTDFNALFVFLVKF